MTSHDLAAFRQSKDEFFKTDPHSPLSREQKRAFSSLAYFPENPDLRLEVALEPFDEYSEIEMQTTTGDVQVYQREGRITFPVDGQEASLTVYSNEYGYFLPFVDSLMGKETYPAGRYLEPDNLGEGRLWVDFNLAYNPYCAYSPRWSCPLTPFENRLKVAIRAGEKIPEGEWVEHE